MRVAIAGSGDVARYFCEEFPKHGHEVVILTRSHKPHLDGPGVVQHVTDYSVQSLTARISDCEALISTILDYSMAYVDVHLALIEACKRSPKCKRFIPSEFGGNLEEYPDLPAFYYRTREPIRKVLRDQHELEWTLVSVGWFIDYVVPAKNRYLKDIGEAFPIDLSAGKIIIPGTGNEPVDITWARDAAKGMGALLNAPTWETYTYMSGQKTCWNDVAEIIKRRHPDFSLQHKSLAQLIETLRTSQDEDAQLIAEYQIFSASHASSFVPAKVKAQQETYFQGVHFRALREGLDEVDADSSTVV